MPIDPYPRRRSLLATGAAGTAALLLAGCADGGASAAERGEASLARRLRRRAAHESAELLDRYDRTAAAHPDLAERLGPLRADVVRHARAFRGADRPEPTGGSGSSAPDAPSPSAAPGTGHDVPADRRRALAELAHAERSTADARTRALLQAPPELARLLASVAAAGAVHAYLLTNQLTHDEG